jgi:type VI secretion system secreted protein Hcp
MAIYMKIDGVNGDATEAQFRGWFNVSTLTWPLISTVTYTGQGKTNPGSITVTTPMALGSPTLMQFTANGNAINSVEFDMTANFRGEEIVAQIINLGNVRLSGYLVTGDSGSSPVVTLSFVFQSVRVSYKVGTNQQAGWDFGQNKAI